MSKNSINLPDLSSGMCVNIYEDPYTQQKLEGRAKLISKVRWAPDPVMQRWLVVFPGESLRVERIIDQSSELTHKILG